MPLTHLVLAALLGCGGGEPAPTFQGTALDAPRPAPDFVLTSHSGAPARLSDFRGDVALLFFGFTSCATVCPAALQTVERALGDVPGAEEVRVLFVTVDPETDTPEQLDVYLAPYGERFVGLTGSPAVLEQVRGAYGAFADRPTPDAELVHTSALYGIDREGALRVVLGTSDPAVIAADVRTLLALPTPEARREGR